MSSIPQRKKTPEELAALRAEDFLPPPQTAHPASAPPEPPQELAHHRRFMPPEKHGIFHDMVGQRLADAALVPVEHLTVLPETNAAPARSARKAPPEKHGHIHAFEGLRPDAATEVFLGQQGAVAQLPHRKHDGTEIKQLRYRGLMQTRPPVQSIMQMALNPVLASILYLIAIAVIYLTASYWSHEGQQRFYSPAAGCSFLLITSLILYLKKPRGRHHAAFLCGIACIILGFVILLTLKNPYAP